MNNLAGQRVEFRDEASRADFLRAIPKQWRRRVGAIHAGKMARAGSIRHEIAQRYEIEREADSWLSDMAGRVSGVRVPVDISDGELCELAERCAHKAMTLGEFAPGFHVSDSGALRARLNAYVEGFGVVAPGGEIEDAPALSRMTCPLWWRRALRRAQGRQLEGAAIALGYVHKRAEIYASNATVERRTQQRRRNALNLENTEAVNLDTGEIVNLAKLAEATVANPRIRRGELMTRIAGFELVARGLGHVAEFVTLTCPSVFHARRTAAGGGSEENPRHDGSTPRDAAKYLGKVWARIRAKLARMDIRPYGFRIAEPHGDGCPHWHVLLFCAAVEVGAVREVIAAHALALDGDEPGAAANRVKFVSVDGGRGSAAGYVAKYVSKNIDGGGVSVKVDLAGDATYQPSQRVEAWASTWGIRQFQQIGGPPVGVWRELRRLEKGGEYSEAVEAARAAADCGPLSREEGGEQKTAEFWARYVAVQGGPVVRRDSLAVGLAKTQPGQRWDAMRQVTQAPSTRYGEIAPARVYGVRDVLSGQTFDSLRGVWEVRRGGNDGRKAGNLQNADEEARILEVGDERECKAAAGGNAEAGGGLGSLLGGGFWVPRTRGNNCTPSKFGGKECSEELQRVGGDLAERERIFGWFLSRQPQGVEKWN